MKIAILGFQHETNTFSNIKAKYNDFLEADNWPGMLIGDEILSNMCCKAIPISGFIEAALKDDINLFPVLWCSAPPSGPVDMNAYIAIKSKIIDGLLSLPDIDAIYLDLHGAMVAEDEDDADGRLLREIRTYFPKKIIVSSIDYHANISSDMVEFSDKLVPYRTYPHIDMFDIGIKSYLSIKKIYLSKKRYKKVYKKIPYLIPMTAQSTLIEPCISIFHQAGLLEKTHDVIVEIVMGFPLSDILDIGPTILIYSSDDEDLSAILLEIESYFLHKVFDFNTRLYSCIESIKEIKKATIERKLLLADTQDNPGCGGTSDTTLMLHTALNHKIKNIIFGLLYDPDAAAMAHQVGVGNYFLLSLGGKLCLLEQNLPVTGSFKVISLSEGSFIAKGPFYYNVQMDLGLMALIEIGGIHIVICSKKCQAADQEMFLHLGISWSNYSVVVLKSSIHYKAHFEELLYKDIVIEAPGFNVADLKKLTYRKKPNYIKVL